MPTFQPENEITSHKCFQKSNMGSARRDQRLGNSLGRRPEGDFRANTGRAAQGLDGLRRRGKDGVNLQPRGTWSAAAVGRRYGVTGNTGGSHSSTGEVSSH